MNLLDELYVLWVNDDIRTSRVFPDYFFFLVCEYLVPPSAYNGYFF